MVPLSFWYGTSSGGGPQQSTAQGTVTCVPVTLQKACTINDMWGMNPLPMGSQHLPAMASLTPWSVLEYAPSHCCSFQPSLFSFLHRNCPILRIVGAGGQVIDSEIAAVYLHMAIRHWARANVASSLPSLRGHRSGHQAKSSSVYCSSQHCDHLVVFQSGSTSPPSTCGPCTTLHGGASLFSFGALSCTL